MLFCCQTLSAGTSSIKDWFMHYILIVSQDASCRRLYVDNLVRRGYLAAGVASSLEAANLLHAGMPSLTLVCCMPTTYEREIDRLRTTFDVTGPLVLMTADRPDPAWAARLNIAASLTETVDPQRLVETLRPWLPDMRAAA
jgi:DNA-binding NtrC family response regulator